jgi:hypothetical protein
MIYENIQLFPSLLAVYCCWIGNPQGYEDAKRNDESDGTRALKSPSMAAPPFIGGKNKTPVLGG